MKILVLNDSPKKEHSDCLRLTRAFLRGMGEEAEILHAVDLHVKPCLGCFACWKPGAVGCIQQDDMNGLLQKIVASDMVIWSFHLYCYGMPAPLKAVVDRLLALSTSEQKTADDGSTYHPNKQACAVRFMMISGCGFPNIDHNYEGVTFQFEKMFGSTPRILCAEAPLLNIPEAAPVADAYLALVEQAGHEYAQSGVISPETQRKLDTPMFDPVAYRQMSSGK